MIKVELTDSDSTPVRSLFLPIDRESHNGGGEEENKQTARLTDTFPRAVACSTAPLKPPKSAPREP